MREPAHQAGPRQEQDILHEEIQLHKGDPGQAETDDHGGKLFGPAFRRKQTGQEAQITDGNADVVVGHAFVNVRRRPAEKARAGGKQADESRGKGGDRPTISGRTQQQEGEQGKHHEDFALDVAHDAGGVAK